jgi:beta-phosphoglucomutase-like phosphatase (HAD superfamily)
VETTPDPLDLDTLVGHWRTALDAAASALHAGSHDLPVDELRRRAGRLAGEREETVRLLGALAPDRHARRPLVRLAASPWERRRLLGLPPDAAACVFNLDGVLIGSAAIHADAWREVFEEFILRRAERTGGSFAQYDARGDYATHMHGRPRLEGIRSFLASRGISLPDGAPDDPADAETVHGLANRKRLALLRRLDEGGVTAYEGARLYLELAHDAGIHSAVVSASSNTETMLERARLAPLVDDRVDGTTMLAERLRRKPASDTLLAACRHLDVADSRLRDEPRRHRRRPGRRLRARRRRRPRGRGELAAGGGRGPRRRGSRRDPRARDGGVTRNALGRRPRTSRSR